MTEPKVLQRTGELYGLGGPPKLEQFREISDQWRPFRTWATVLVRLGGDRAARAGASGSTAARPDRGRDRRRPRRRTGQPCAATAAQPRPDRARRAGRGVRRHAAVRPRGDRRQQGVCRPGGRHPPDAGGQPRRREGVRRRRSSSRPLPDAIAARPLVIGRDGPAHPHGRVQPGAADRSRARTPVAVRARLQRGVRRRRRGRGRDLGAPDPRSQARQASCPSTQKPFCSRSAAGASPGRRCATPTTCAG